MAGAASSTAHAMIPPVPGERVSLDRLPGFAADPLDGLSDALARQCRMSAPPAPWPVLCAQWRGLPAGASALRGWLQARFEAVALVGPTGDTQGLITGYHEPLVAGSRGREGARQVPLLRRPPDPARGQPWPTRAQIDAGALPDSLALVWIDDPVDAFFLQVQGSGRVRLRDGSILRVAFAGTNGHPYRAIGRTLVERGALTATEVDAPAIKAWLRTHPDQARDVMQTNPRYVFFRELPASIGDEGPPGSLGVPLTPMRSIATDPRHVPPGSLMFLATRHPGDDAPLARVVLAQDTGAAITGEVRADLFWGPGEAAERHAGLMKHPGRLWRLIPRDLASAAPPQGPGR